MNKRDQSAFACRIGSHAPKVNVALRAHLPLFGAGRPKVALHIHLARARKGNRLKGVLVRFFLRPICFGIVLSGLFSVVTPAVAGDAPSGLENLFREHYEFRLGGFAHGVGGNESGSVDVNAELIFPQLWPDIVPQSWNWLVPRPHIGVSLNTAGKTDYGYVGGLWTLNVTRRFFVETFVGGAVHDGTINGDPDRSALGSRVLFHVGGSVGYRLTRNWNVLFTFEHLSNGNAALHAAPSNQGLNEYGLRVGYVF